MKTFQGRVVTPGCAQAEALVTHGGLNTLASFQKSLQFGDKTAKCGDQNNPDLYGKPMAGKALCLPQTIGSTTGGLVLYCACAMDRQPACMLFANPIDSLAAAGAILADVWLQPGKMPVVDSLGEEFLSYVKDGMTVTIGPNGTVTVDYTHRTPSPAGKPWALPRRCINQVFTKKRSRCLRGLFSWFSIDLTGSGRSRPGSA